MALLLSACAGPHKLAGTPNILRVATPVIGTTNVDSRVAIDSQKKVFFVTDRGRVKGKENGNTITFGAGRSDAMSMGYTTVQLQSSGRDKNKKIQVDVIDTSILTDFPATPLPLVKSANGIVIREDARKEYEQSTMLMQYELTRHMVENNQRELLLFVHGFNNDFDDAVLSLNDIWQYSDKKALPMVYTWPAGAGGLMSYFTDRESGEFSIFHLKETLRILVSIDQIERIHVIAHSRGTDVTTTALRELIIEARGKFKDPRKVRESLKISNLIMAAPDIDYGVVKQRLIAEKFGTAFGQITIYMNKEDSALGLSQVLMKGVRFGRLLASQQGRSESEIFAVIDNVAFIDVEDVAGFLGHGYFHQHPGVMSDILVLLETNSKPGSVARPLIHDRSNFWQLRADYLIDNDKSASEASNRPVTTTGQNQ